MVFALQVCERMMPGYGEQMRAISLRYVPTAVLSRQTAGLRGKSLLLNLPGRPKAIRETIDEVGRRQCAMGSVPAEDMDRFFLRSTGVAEQGIFCQL